MLIKPNWDNFKAKFNENPQDNFEWFCYLLFSKEYNQPYGAHRYKNQSGIETDPIKVGNEVIGWQSKFYEDTLSNHKEDLLGTLTKAKRDNPNITKIILYTNAEWGQGQGTKEPKAKTETEEKAKELNIELIWRVKSYFESPFVTQEQRDISSYFFELNTKWELSNYGFIDTLKDRYLNHFNTISLLLDKPKPIDEIFINLAIIKEKEKKKDDGKIPEKQIYDNNWEAIHKPKERIDKEELINISKKSLIYGKAGIGKTTLCKHIAYTWAKGELYSEFVYVIYIPLREWKNEGLKGAIRDYYYSQDEKNITIDIKENSQKMLFLFDGYDELDGDKKKALIREIEHCNLTHYIITTRPYGYQKDDFRVDEHFETIGFTDENVKEYIETFFKENSKKSKSLNGYLKSNISIRHIAYIPLMLEMICSLWEKNEFSDSLTMTELYTKIIDNLLSDYARKKGYEEVYKRKYKKQVETYLGSIAFESLKNQTIIIDREILEKSLNNITIDDEDDFLEKNIFYTGLLKSDNKYQNPWKNNYEFPHLTFQEYFSALYVSRLSKEEQREIIQDWKFYPHMQMFFAFLGGLIEDKEFLFEEIESEPRDLVGVYEFKIINLVIKEIKKEYLNNDRIIIINNSFRKWLKNFKNTDSMLYNKIISDRLNSISHILDEKSLYELLLLVKKNAFETNIVDYIFQLPIFFEKNKIYNDKFFDILIEIINVIRSGYYYDFPTMKSLHKVFSFIAKENENFLDLLIQIMEDTTEDGFNKRLKHTIANILALVERTDSKIVNPLINYISNRKYDWEIRGEIALLLISLELENSNSIQKIINFVKEENTCMVHLGYQVEVIKYLESLSYPYNEDEQKIFSLKKNLYDDQTLKWTKRNQEKNIFSDSNYVENKYYQYNPSIYMDMPTRKDEYYEFIEYYLLQYGDEYIKNKVREVFSLMKKDNISIIDAFKEIILIDNKFIKKTINILKDKDIDCYTRKNLGKRLYLFEKNDNEYLYALRDIIKKDNIVNYMDSKHDEIYNRDELTEGVSYAIKWSPQRKDDEYIKFLLKFKDIIDSHDIFIDLLLQVERKDKSFVNELFELLVSDIDTSSKEKLASSLYRLKIEDDWFVEDISKNIKSIDHLNIQYCLAFSLCKLNRCNDKNVGLVVDYLSKLNREPNKLRIENIQITKKELLKQLVLLGEKNNKEFYIFKKIHSFRENNKEVFYRFSFEILFKAYDENYFILDIILQKSCLEVFSLYVKNNKLHTVENGKEISTQREVDEEALNKIKMLLERDVLNN